MGLGILSCWSASKGPRRRRTKNWLSGQPPSVVPLAVDTVLALPAAITAGEVDEEGALALEDVMDELFSVPHEFLRPKI